MSTDRARRVEVPSDLPSDPDLTGAHYTSAFELPTPTARSWTPEQWARAVFEGAPLALRGVLLTGWTAVLRLRLGPRPSPKHILGRPIAAADADSITVTARSRLITAHNIVLVRDASVVWTTVVRFERPITRPIWGAAAPIHHLTIPWLLQRARRDAPSA